MSTSSTSGIVILQELVESLQEQLAEATGVTEAERQCIIADTRNAYRVEWEVVVANMVAEAKREVLEEVDKEINLETATLVIRRMIKEL